MANLSDPAALPADRTAPDWIGALSASRGFVPDPGLHSLGQSTGPDPEDTATVEALAQAYAQGEAAGRAAATAEWEAKLEIGADLGRVLTRFDAAARRAIQLRLAETVATLCEQVIKPHLIDRTSIESRCDEALRWIDGGPERLQLHLHPDDINMLGEDRLAVWNLAPDPSLPRGSLLLEGPEGLVSDGPDEWRRAIAGALSQ
jgi:flagellar assembly protein FliH